jgi:hypothetical protein
VLISTKVPLPLRRIALAWADELNEDINEVVRPLLYAFIQGKIKPARQDHNDLLSWEPVRVWYFTSDTDPLDYEASILKEDQKCSYVGRAIAIQRGDGWDTSKEEDVITDMIDCILSIEVTRDEFLRWVEDQGYPRPTFWDPVIATNDNRTALKVPRPARERDRVKELMRADVAAGKFAIRELRVDKEAWAKMYSTTPSTARDAALELEKELKASN